MRKKLECSDPYVMECAGPVQRYSFTEIDGLQRVLPFCQAHREQMAAWLVAREAERRAMLDAEALRKRAAYIPVPRTQGACARCADSFVAARSDARYCSARCRVAAHRAQRR